MKMELGYADKTQIERMFRRFMGMDDIEPTKSLAEEDSLDIEKKKTLAKLESKELKELAVKFTDMIPNLHVTPAELQKFFIMNMMDQGEFDDESTEKIPNYDYLLDAVPEFLVAVAKDRLQAQEHKEITGKKKLVNLETIKAEGTIENEA